MRILVFGGWGQLGAELARAAEGRHELVRPTRVEVDVADPAAVAAAVAGSLPRVVVDAAAFHRVEDCEREPERALAVNALGALAVARAAAGAGARAVFVSTDYVFGGRPPTGGEGHLEDEAHAPVNAYGVSKAAGELALRAACPDSLVVRVSGLFGHAGSSGKGGNFVETMLARAASGERLAVVDDQVLAPTAAAEAADRLVALLEAGAPPGTYHLANRGALSWHAFAATIFRLAGVPADLVPRRTGPEEVRRPANSVLEDTRTAALGIPPARTVEEALAWYLAERGAGPRP